MKKTERSIGDRISVPMCGIQLYSIEAYTENLKHRGYYVLICRQFEEKGKICRKISEDIFPETEAIDLAPYGKNIWQPISFFKSKREEKRGQADRLLWKFGIRQNYAYGSLTNPQ